MARKLPSMLKMLVLAAGAVSPAIGGTAVIAEPQATPGTPTVQQGSNSSHVNTGQKTKAHSKKKAKKEVVEVPPPPPPPPPTPEQLPAQVPEVLYSGGMLTINAPNSTMNDVLSAVRRVTGATIEKPPIGGNDRVVVHLGPGQPKDVLASLFNGSRYDYIIVGPMGQPGGVQRIILTARATTPAQSPMMGNAPGRQPPNMQAPPPQQEEPETEDMTVPEQNAPEQEAPPEQPQEQQQQPQPQPGYPQPVSPEQQPQAQQPQGQEDQGQQPRVKSPEELLRELQQMQKQQQEQQQNQQQPPQ